MGFYIISGTISFYAALIEVLPKSDQKSGEGKDGGGNFCNQAKPSRPSFLHSQKGA